MSVYQNLLVQVSFKLSLDKHQATNVKSVISKRILLRRQNKFVKEAPTTEKISVRHKGKFYFKEYKVKI